MSVGNNRIPDDPIQQFKIWYNEAIEVMVHEPDAAVVSSINDVKPECLFATTPGITVSPRSAHDGII